MRHILIFFKSHKFDFFKVPLLLCFVFFLLSMLAEAEQKIEHFEQIVLLIFPILLIVPYVQHSVQQDVSTGILESWIGSGYSILSYFSINFFVFIVVLALQLQVVYYFFNNNLCTLTYAFSASLLLSNSLLIMLSIILGFSALSASLTIFLLVPFQIPSMLITLSSIKAGDLSLSIMIQLGMIMILTGIIFIINPILKRVSF